MKVSLVQKIAVLIPTYKPKSYILRCFDSLNRQTIDRNKYCVYVALNGPCEEYAEYLECILKSMRFKYKLIFLELADVSNARNTLMEFANEDYIVFVDDDDCLSEDYLQSLLDVSLPGYISVANVHKFYEGSASTEKNYIGRCFDRLPEVEKNKFKSRQYFSSPWAKLIHKDMVGDVKFEVGLKRGEDALFMAKISRNVLGVVKANPCACYYVCHRDGSASRGSVGFWIEIRRQIYLCSEYGKLLFMGGYDRVFILSRLFATIRQGGRVLL